MSGLSPENFKEIFKGRMDYKIMIKIRVEASNPFESERTGKEEIDSVELCYEKMLTAYYPLFTWRQLTSLISKDFS